MGLIVSICPCLKQRSAEDVAIEMQANIIQSGITNDSVTCKAGQHGEKIKISLDSNIYNISGSGITLGSCPLDCDTGYWEVRIGNNPEGVHVGVKRYKSKKGNQNTAQASLNGSLKDEDNESPNWFFQGKELKTNDVVGIYWNQTDLPMVSFTLNGESISAASVNRIRPAIDIHPAISIVEGSTCDMIFNQDKFLFPPKGSKFSQIVCATSII